jgi:hypothetical protein
MPNSYVHIDEFQSALGITDDVGIDNLDRALDAAVGWVEHHCGRTFGLQAAQTREFYPRTDGTVDVVDLVSVTSIKTDTSGNRTFATTLTTSDYILLPRNGTRYQRVQIWPQSSRGFSPTTLVQIVGSFGYVEGGQVPPAVKQAVIFLANRWHKRPDAPFGILGSTELGQFERLSAKDYDVLMALEPYRLSDDWILV